MRPHVHRIFLILYGAILILALLLRLRGLDTTGLWGDQAFTLNTALRWLNGGAMPLAANKSSVGFVNPPMVEYLYAAALLLWRDVLSVSLLTVLGGLLAVAVTGGVTARLFGRRAGLWAMLAFAVTPWAVAWSQQIWNQTLVPPFGALALGGLLLYLADRPRAVYLIGSFAAAAAMTQLHPGSAIQLLTMGLALLLFRRRVRLTHVLAGVAVFALLYMPYLLYQIGTGWADFRAAGDLAGQDATFGPAAVLLSLDLIRAQGLYRSVPRTAAFDAVAVVLFVGAFVVVVWRWAVAVQGSRGTGEQGRKGAGENGQWSGDKSRLVSGRTAGVASSAVGDRRSDFIALTILLLWFLLPLLFYLRSAVYLQNYYLLGQWPAHFMILGIGLDTAQRVLERRGDRGEHRRLWQGLAWLPAVPFLALFTFQTLFVLRYQDARVHDTFQPFQVRHARSLIATSRRLLAENPDCRFVGIGHGQQIDTSNLGMLPEFVDPGRVIVADGDLALPRPFPCAVYLDARPGSRASALLAAQAEAVPDGSLAVGPETWQFYRWADDPATAETPIAQWTMGAALTGYEAGELTPGQPWPLQLAWEVVAEPDGLYQFGVYLLDAAGALMAQHDGPGFDSAQWRAGDRFITFHELPIPAELPPGVYRPAAALYTWPDIVRAELVGGGNTAYLPEIGVGK